jgi:hypothetical protein
MTGLQGRVGMVGLTAARTSYFGSPAGQNGVLLRSHSFSCKDYRGFPRRDHWLPGSFGDRWSCGHLYGRGTWGRRPRLYHEGTQHIGQHSPQQVIGRGEAADPLASAGRPPSSRDHPQAIDVPRRHGQDDGLGPAEGDLRQRGVVGEPHHPPGIAVLVLPSIVEARKCAHMASSPRPPGSKPGCSQYKTRKCSQIDRLDLQKSLIFNK